MNSRSRAMRSINLLTMGCTSSAYSKEPRGKILGSIVMGANVHAMTPSVYMRPFKPHHAAVCFNSLSEDSVDTDVVAILIEVEGNR
mmetsp:Transcript_19270/g.32651  ORF Transcript_19270/g.32651 Transcript_19270/m.32651 type:complete len:86 (+) Transcript_19270:1622-1879(+)